MNDLNDAKLKDGHGGLIFGDATQDKLIIAGLRWVVETDKKGNVFLK